MSFSASQPHYNHGILQPLVRFQTVTASPCLSYGLATVRYPVLEISATIEGYRRGFSLRVLRAWRPREAIRNWRSSGRTEGAEKRFAS